MDEKITESFPDEIYLQIIQNLEQFEEQKQFLKKGITLNKLAKKMNTNASYLSKAVNSHKGKSFANYLNDLRIDYVIQQITEDKKLRTYKISGIAAEMGYNNKQTFALVFKRKTGITISAYIKKINSLEENPDNPMTEQD